MAGNGQRFKDCGYLLPKPLIEIMNTTIIDIALSNINIEGNYIFVVRRSHYDKYLLKQKLSELRPNCQIVIAETETAGQTSSALLAETLINTEEPLLILNCDDYILFDVDIFLKIVEKETSISGAILTFKDDTGSTRWSYAKITNGFVTEIAEKLPISTNALAGIFYWATGKHFVDNAKAMIEKNIKTNGEFYIAPVYNESIHNNNSILNYTIDGIKSMGTPEDLKRFEEWAIKNNKIFNKI